MKLVHRDSLAVAVAVAVMILVALACGSYFAWRLYFSPFSDHALINRFERERQALHDVAISYEQEGGLSSIWPDSVYPAGRERDAGRVVFIREQMKRLQVKRVSYAGDYMLFYVRFADEPLSGEVSKGFAFTRGTGPAAGLLRSSLNDDSQLERGFNLRKISSEWYLFAETE